MKYSWANPVLTALLLLLCSTGSAQETKVAVFDIDLMVQAMPAYRQVDSLVEKFERDSLAPELEIYQLEYLRLDSSLKRDSILVSEGKKSKKILDYTFEQRQKVAFTLAYWQQIAQNRSNLKRRELARPLFEQVAQAYKNILDKKKYLIVLKPQTYEWGSNIDNLFLSVARALKLSTLPDELAGLGLDPDKPGVLPKAGKK